MTSCPCGKENCVENDHLFWPTSPKEEAVTEQEISDFIDNMPKVTAFESKPAKRPRKVEHDHGDRCCTLCDTHSTPHKGCILR